MVAAVVCALVASRCLTVLLPGNTLIPCKHALSLMLPLQAQGLQQLCHRLTMYPEVSMVL